MRINSNNVSIVRKNRRKGAKVAVAAFTASMALLAGCATTAASDKKLQESKGDGAPLLYEVNKLHETGGRGERVVLSYDGGLATIDGETGKTLKATKREGFMRLSNAGNGRHVWVSAGDEFLLYDVAIEAQPHGDHNHYYEGTPKLTKIALAAPHAGHVVVHGGKTVLFSDGDAAMQIMDTDKIGKPNLKVHKLTASAGHHGVAVVLDDGTLFHTVGTEEERHTVQVVAGTTKAKAKKIVAKTDDCPGSHGEATAKPTDSGDVLVMGCTNGPVVYRDDEFHKVPVADAYSRSGNLAGHPDSPIILGDYKVDPEATVERTTRIALINTRTDSLQVVDLGSSYWFRSLGRTASGDGVVLTYDGNLNIINVETGEIKARIPAISPWQEKEDWQQPGPILRMLDDIAYVTDANTNELVRVDVANGQELSRVKLDFTPVEMAVTNGFADAH